MASPARYPIYIIPDIQAMLRATRPGSLDGRIASNMGQASMRWVTPIMFISWIPTAIE
jgi:hypothetical protein